MAGRFSENKHSFRLKMAIQMKKLFMLGLACLISGPSFADLQVQFIEGAPKDRFVITNYGGCAVESAEFKIDFTGTSAGLIFDVTGDGAGVEVFQPFDVTSGAKFLKSEPEITDGDQVAVLQFAGFEQSQSIEFTIDVDDTAGAREITVSDDEIRGAVVSVTIGGKEFAAEMETNAKVLVGTGLCQT